MVFIYTCERGVLEGWLYKICIANMYIQTAPTTTPA